MNVSRVRSIFILLMLCIAQMAAAQPAGRAAFRTLGIRDGLSSNSVTSMLADSRGYLWVGTTQGLNRYDGHEVKSRFPETGEQQLYEVFNNLVTSIEEDAEGRIWIECESGSYCLYNTRTARFSASVTNLLHSLGMRCDDSYKVKVGMKGTLWVLTGNTIYRYDCHSKELNTWEAQLPMPGKTANVVAETSDGLYISAGHALWHFISSTGTLRQENLPEVMQQSMGEHRLLADADGTLWVYSTREEHVCRYIVGGRCVREMVSLPQTIGDSQNNAIRDMMDDGRGNIWIATDHQGVFVYDKRTGTITSMRHQRENQLSLASDNATCLATDRDGTVWVGHLKTGLSYTSDANNVMQAHAPQCGDILAMAYDEQGRLWMGTDGNGIYIEMADGSIQKTALPNITVMALLSDRRGGMWAGTYNQGLYHLPNVSQWKRYSVDDGTFPSETVWTLASDSKGNIWTSSPIGKTVVFNPDDESATVIATDEGADIHGNSLHFDGDHTMYIASVYGMWSYNVDSGECNVAFGNKRGTQQWMSQMVTDVMTDRRQGLMMLTHPDGMTIFDTANDTLYTIGPVADVIKDMTRDKSGIYWLCSASGNVTGIQPERQDNGRIITLHSSFFTPHAGMPQFYFNGGAMTCSPQGEILMGGTEGYMSINPSQLITTQPQDRDLEICEIAVGDSLLNELTTTVALGHDAPQLTVKFFSGSLDGVKRIRYAYRLVGQTSHWTTTDHNSVSFHTLPPGDYTLQLCVCHEDGTMSQPHELHITVAPPFYRSLPMYIAYALAIVAIGFFQWRRMRKRQQERTEQQRQMMERQKMEQITEMKLKFFTNISHDLRTPLTLIISPLEQMMAKMEKASTPEGQAQGDTYRNKDLLAQLRNIHKNAQLLLSEVSALLDFRRLDAGGETLNMQRADIVDHLNSILVSFGDYAEERGIRLSFQHDCDSFVMEYDREKMNKVVYNLFSNAMKFTPSGGNVTLTFMAGQGEKDGHSEQQDYVTITVADTGKGISDIDKPHIFRRFYQSASNDSSQTGSGIGLHIAYDYVKLHHGTISVSDNKPVGTVFTITLPVTAIAIDATENTATGKPSSPISHSSHPHSSLFTLHSSLPKLLIVDDNADMLSFVSNCMAEVYQVSTATDGDSALSILQHEQIDLVISDVMMPGIDGFELCRRVKSDISLSHIPVILLTARTTDVSRIEGLQLGADDYLTKPFNVEVLRLRVKKIIEWAQNNHQQFRQKINIEPSEITITPLDEEFIKRAIDLVEKNIGDSDFSVETLASAVAMSRSTLYKKLMAITGLGPSEFIRTIRIKRGKALLETSQMQITEIAYAVGFTTVKSFTMNFKAEYGMTPSEFRNRT